MCVLKLYKLKLSTLFKLLYGIIWKFYKFLRAGNKDKSKFNRKRNTIRTERINWNWLNKSTGRWVSFKRKWNWKFQYYSYNSYWK